MFRDMLEARTKKPGNPNAKSPSETKQEKLDKETKKHKKDSVSLPETMIESLKVLGNLKEEEIEYTTRGLKFTFENSMQANYCQIIEYHDSYIVELRKKSDNLIEGKMDILVSEEVINPENLIEHFENCTGIYISYLEV